MAKDKIDIWMPIYVGDYLSDTMHLTTEQHGAYFLLLMAYWKNRGALFKNRLKSIVQLSDENSWTILEEFFDTESEPDKWIHRRIEKELKIAIARKEAAETKGKKGMMSRWGQKKKDSSANSSAIAEGIVEGIAGDNPSPSPSPSPSKKKKNKEIYKEKEKFLLPDWIPKETWEAYLKLRKRKKAESTDYALSLIIKELEKIKHEYGHDPVEVLNKSIKSGWVDVYPLKDKQNDNGKTIPKNLKGLYELAEEWRDEGKLEPDIGRKNFSEGNDIIDVGN